MMRNLFATLLLSLAACGVAGTSSDIPTAEGWAGACEPWDDWDKPGPPFRIHGNSYYVGTCGIAAILVTGEQGHILIDGASRGGGPLIEANVEALGFRLRDIRFLLHTHEHFDHVGGLAYLQEKSGAKVLASTLAAPVLESGETATNDPQAGMHDPFEPVEVGGIVSDGGSVSVGNVTVNAIFTPGHTRGALSWQWSACDGGDCREIVYMDSLSPISAEGFRFSDDPSFVARFRRGLETLRRTACDIAVTPHPAASGMFDRINEGGLEDPDRCRIYAEAIAARLDRRLAEEAG